ncbi:hypothetical protein GCM10022377_24370 [Zhihengliuella alba]|uniref:DUF8083 domain-containing protein n=1 Tax=Zhihengliuella alba TaxID=547018 RepID=A0ABP7DT77_9MICC
MAAGGATARRRLPPTAHLRVFEPLRAFDEREQLLLQQLRPEPRAEAEERLAREALRRVLRTVSDPYPPAGVEHYRVLHYPGHHAATTPFYCPDQLSTRATLAAEQLDRLMRPQLLSLVIPEPARAANAERLDSDEFADDLAHLHTRTSVWGVPLEWFVAVHEDDHAELDEDGDTLVGVRLSAPLVQVLERVRLAAASLAVNAPEMDLLDDLTGLAEWLQTFHDDSVVELDYGLLAEFVWPDESPQDLRLGIESLREGDMLGAAAAYRRLTNRWAAVRHRARSN